MSEKNYRVRGMSILGFPLWVCSVAENPGLGPQVKMVRQVESAGRLTLEEAKAILPAVQRLNPEATLEEIRE